ncbi:MAG: nucleotide pyrophosphohydrolase [Anaerolinea sp.]|nr:nucleotide pyrophosphohydrolase [Anaerolinea sp.]
MSDLNALTAAMHAFVESKGWYAPGSPHPQTPRALAISLALEAGEVLEHFQWTDPAWADLGPAVRAELGAELADVLLYLLQIASLAGIDLAEAVQAKLRLNASRTWDEPRP